MNVFRRLFSLFLLGAHLPSIAASELRFTREDAEVLQRVARVNELGNAGAKLLLLAPIAEMVLSMNSPVEFAVSVSDADWSGLASSAKKIKKIAACSAQLIVHEHLDLGVPKPKGAARQYFERLLTSLSTRCEG